jgi:hypothetical protein
LQVLESDYLSSSKKDRNHHDKENKSPVLSPGMTEKSNKLHLELQKLQSKIMGLEEKLNEQPMKSLTERSRKREEENEK